MSLDALAQTWPPARVRVTTPRLELRLPTEAELCALARVAVEGVHDPATMPFASPWSDAAPDDIPPNLLQWHWRCRASWKPCSWTLLLAAFVDGQPAGMQDIAARDFAITRQVTTGSWLGRAWQGRGLGREMRDAVLHLAFEGLGALDATSGAYDDNAPSIAVSRGAGYEDDGVNVVVRSRGERAPGGPVRTRATELRFRLTRERWLAARRNDIRLAGTGDERVRAAFGIDA